MPDYQPARLPTGKSYQTAGWRQCDRYAIAGSNNVIGKPSLLPGRTGTYELGYTNYTSYVAWTASLPARVGLLAGQLAGGCTSD